MKPGEVRKSPEGWARFRERTENGARKREAVRPFRSHRPKGGKRG